MKTFTFYFAFIFALLNSNLKSIAQNCTIINPSVQIISTNQVGASCNINFNLSFEGNFKGGSKFIFFHFWLSNQYSSVAFRYNTPPTNGLFPTLSSAVLNLGLDNTTNTPTVITTYAPDNTITLKNGYTIYVKPLTNGDVHYNLQNLNISVPNSLCGKSLSLIGDVWSTTLSSTNTVSCFNKNITLLLTDPIIKGTCQNSIPGKLNTYSYSIDIPSNPAILSEEMGVVTTYLDDGDRIFEPSVDKILTGPNPRVISSWQTPYNFNLNYYPSGGSPDYSISKIVFVEMKLTQWGVPSSIVAAIEPCASSTLTPPLANGTPKIISCNTLIAEWLHLCTIINASKNRNGLIIQYQNKLDQIHDAYLINKCTTPLPNLKGYKPS